MDGFDEKKWFVYLGDHHEGPFSLREIGEKMNQSIVSRASYVWCDGMSDWKAMPDVPAFETLLQGSPPPVESVSVEVPMATSPTFSDAMADATILTQTDTIPRPEVAASGEPSFAQSAEPAPPVSPVESSPTPKLRRERKPVSKGVWAFAVVALGAGGIATMYFQGFFGPDLFTPLEPVTQKLVELVPPLANVFSPIGALDDVSPEDLKELRAAAISKPPFAGIAVSKADPIAPSFYISTSAEDGTSLSLTVTGKPDTLLNQTRFEATLPATLIKRIAKSAPLRGADGKAIPRGEYVLVVKKGAEVLGKKSAFLGGPKDATYESRLKEFHDRIKARAAQEVVELRQFAETLHSQLQSTTDKYVSLRGPVTSVHRKVWNGFHRSWTQLQDKLTQTAQGWSAQALEQEYYYTDLYRRIQAALPLLTRLHELQNQHFSPAAKPADPAAVDAQLVEARAHAEEAVGSLRAVLDRIEKATDNPSGLPYKEGT